MSAELKFNEEITKKYDVVGLNPGPVQMAARFGSQTMDLRKVSVAVIDAFVARYKDQPYFKLKSAATATSSPK